MKYVRTKDNIYDIEKYGGIRTITKIYDVDESFRPKYENTNEPQQVGDQFIFIDGKDYKVIDNNTADTIEELCDKFIKIRQNLPPLISQNGILWGWKKPTEEVYGAIWTDKGLIYVARMNEEGQLELL